MIAIIPTADRQKATVKVRVGFEQLDPRILPQMSVKVAFQSAAQETAEAFGVRSVPTLIFFKDGEPLFEMVGAVPKPVLEREIGALLED